MRGPGFKIATVSDHAFWIFRLHAKPAMPRSLIL